MKTMLFPKFNDAVVRPNSQLTLTNVINVEQMKLNEHIAKHAAV